MEIYTSYKNSILDLSKDIAGLIARAGNISGAEHRSFDGWQNACAEIGRQIKSETVRVAVVGPIKSGKSTFLNALLGGDYLKTGAGVMTSIVTRIRQGETLKATLFLKSWEEINQEINQALFFMPLSAGDAPVKDFDINRQADREQLKGRLSSLPREQLITDDARNVNTVILSSYLKGYDAAAPMINAAGDKRVVEYAAGRFHEHRQFTGDEIMAVFLKDILLEIDTPLLRQNLELADCQGSDSPNPLHLAMIQDYLQLAHLVVYVVSSRTGLRQADIRFSSMIRDMGIMENVLFLVNADFNEHGSLADLQRLVNKVREDLTLVNTDPPVFTFSSLFHLFETMGAGLPEKEAVRLRQWKGETELAELSDKEARRFQGDFAKRVTRGRYILLLHNHLERLGVIALGLAQWIAVHRKLLTQGKSTARQIAGEMKGQQQKVEQTKAMVRHALDGSLQKLKQELRQDADRCFDPRSGDLVRHLKGFIRGHAIGAEKYEEMLGQAGFSSTVYLIFQDLKQALDGYMAETVNPRIMRFTREEEVKIAEHLEAVSGSFLAMLKQAMTEYGRSLEALGLGVAPAEPTGPGSGESGFTAEIHLPPMASIRSSAGLVLPPAAATMRYTGRLRTEALMRLGFYSVVHALKRLVRRTERQRRENELRALKYSIARMKKETEKSVDFHLKDFRENLKFQYLLKLAQVAADTLFEMLLDRVEAYVTDMAAVLEQIDRGRQDQDKFLSELNAMDAATEEIRRRIETLREKLLAA